jgi:hypothetical protein
MMSDSPEELDSAEELNGDSQLTIRIPNPKVYMARQSQWKGRRGKPRCDHCRTNNLKCDRVLPTCNHCSWANGRECRYTPLPTPAHRGIPRCDMCRLRNLKVSSADNPHWSCTLTERHPSVTVIFRSAIAVLKILRPNATTLLKSDTKFLRTMAPFGTSRQ